jgi:uncharacterized protein (TIGR00725 family)
VTFIAVCGAAEATPEELATAEEVGRLLARAGATLVCGGLGGVMDAVARGANAENGIALGILPGEDRRGASRHLTASIPTGLGEARNTIIVRSADAVIAIGGEFGTLSEIALALKMGKRVVGLKTWKLSKPGRNGPDEILRAETAEEAVRLALEPT